MRCNYCGIQNYRTPLICSNPDEPMPIYLCSDCMDEYNYMNDQIKEDDDYEKDNN